MSLAAVTPSEPKDVRVLALDELRTIMSPGLLKGRAGLAAVKDALLEKQLNEGSQQIPPQRSLSAFHSSASEIVEPPIDLKLWATQLSRSTRLNRSVRTIARNTVGLGWEIIPRTPFNHDTSEEEKLSVQKESQRVADFFDDAHDEQPFESLLECTVIDEEATGNGYLEFTETLAGKLEKIFHVPSITVRILADGRGFVQLRGTEKRYFKRFSEEKVMDARNGKFQDEEGFAAPERSDSSGDSNATKIALPVEHRASRILHFKLYHPMSEVYGLPKFIAAGAAIAGNWHSAKRNVVFFVNDAVPRMAVLVSGGKLDEESLETIKDYFQDGKGSEEAHRIIVLQTQLEGVGVDEKNNTRVDLKPLTVGVTEDGSFLNYRVANDEEIREAMGLSEVYFKSIKLTKASAVVAKATTDEQEFAPARKIKEHILNKQVIWGRLKAKRVRIKLTAPQTSDPLETAQVAKLYSEIGSMTPNEIRHSLHMDPLPDSEDWANLPFTLALLAAQGKVITASALAVEPPQPTAPAIAAPAASAAEDEDDEDDDSGSSSSSDDDEDGEKTVGAAMDFVEKAAARVRQITPSEQLPNNTPLSRT